MLPSRSFLRERRRRRRASVLPALLLLHLLDEPLDLLLAHLVAPRPAHPAGGLGRERRRIERAQAIVGHLLEVRERVVLARFGEALVEALEQLLRAILVPLGL